MTFAPGHHDFLQLIASDFVQFFQRGDVAAEKSPAGNGDTAYLVIDQIIICGQ